MFTRNWQHTRQSLIWGVHSRSFLPDYYDRKTRPSDKNTLIKYKLPARKLLVALSTLTWHDLQQKAAKLLIY